MVGRERKPLEASQEVSLHALMLIGHKSLGRVDHEVLDSMPGKKHSENITWESLVTAGNTEDSDRSQVVTGIVMRLTGHFIGYFESNEKGLQRVMTSARGQAGQVIKAIFIGYNIRQRNFMTLVSRKFDSLPEELDSRQRNSEKRKGLIQSVLRMVGLIVKLQATTSLKKAMDHVNEKYRHLLPSNSAIDEVLDDEQIPDLMMEGKKRVQEPPTLDDDNLWPIAGSPIILKSAFPEDSKTC